MKRTLVLSLVLLCVTACVQAQDARSEFMKNPALSGSNYVAYPGPKHRLTPAPRGYEPFYLSHYGRHGSRYLIDTHDYDRPTLPCCVPTALASSLPVAGRYSTRYGRYDRRPWAATVS